MSLYAPYPGDSHCMVGRTLGEPHDQSSDGHTELDRLHREKDRQCSRLGAEGIREGAFEDSLRGEGHQVCSRTALRSQPEQVFEFAGNRLGMNLPSC